MLGVLALPLVEVGRRHLLVLPSVAVNSEAGKALGAKRLRDGASGQLGFAVVRQLEIRVGRQSGCARIADIQGNSDFIAVAPERVYLLHLRAIPAGGGQPKHHRVLPGRQAALSGQRPPKGAVVGATFSRNPALGFVRMLWPEQLEILAGIARILVSKQLEALQRAAQRVDLRKKEIRGDPHRLTGGRRRGRSWDATGGCLRLRSRYRLGWGRYSLLRGRRGGRRLRPVLLIPGLPQHEQGKAEDEQQNEPLRVHLQGTGSQPPGCQGPQRHSRRAASQPPRQVPCRPSASSAYSEQLGKNRHAGGSSGLTSQR